ncbi:MAG: molybdopterin-synthase adenylyltransferase MoeB [Pseudomonadales bacterium]|nr:molybdopterin-synthase adenylyltransferase MoeB [Pseudomonadales bacterium]
MNDDELLRYSRQIMLPDIEIEGQEKLLAATVVIVGLGGLGCPVALYLAAAGVGHLVLVDFDEVDLSNLQRQIAHGTDDIGRPKVQSARDAIARLNPGTQVTCINERLEGDALLARIKGASVVVDGSDNFKTRYAVNKACVETGTPLVSGAAIQLEGQAMVYDPSLEDGPCYQCLYQDASDAQFNCAENGVAAPVVGVIGTIQATEVVKLIVGKGTTLAGYLLVFDAKHMDFRKLKLPRNPSCRVCAKKRSP